MKQTTEIIEGNPPRILVKVDYEFCCGDSEDLRLARGEIMRILSHPATDYAGACGMIDDLLLQLTDAARGTVK